MQNARWFWYAEKKFLKTLRSPKCVLGTCLSVCLCWACLCVCDPQLNSEHRVLCISGFFFFFLAWKDFKKLRYSVLSFPEWEPGGNRNRSKCLYSGQEYIWYMESFVLPTIQEWVRFAWNFYASVSWHTVCLMYKINWCINQIKSSMLPTFEFAHRDSIWIWRNSHFKKSLIGDGVTLR